MPNFTGTDSFNFFELPMRNRVDPFTEEENPIEFQTLRKKMTEAVNRPYVCAVGHIARWRDDEGQSLVLPESEIRIPYELEFTSPKQFPRELQFYDGNPDEPIMFYSQLMDELNEGDIVFEVRAPVDPTAETVEMEHIANIRLLTNFRTSFFGDTRLFFQHKRTSHDRKLWPVAWRRLAEDPVFDRTDANNLWGFEVPDVWPDNEREAQAFFIENATHEPWKCPFAWLLPEYSPLQN
jgi:hypothetical protein